MENLTILSKLKELIESDVNIIDYLRSIDKRTNNTIEDIMISYDLQAGTYINEYYKSVTLRELYSQKIARIVEELLKSVDIEYNILEVGVGEATTLGPLLLALKNKPTQCYGFDISWSRIKYARNFIQQLGIKENIDTFTADLFNIPLKDNSIDIVYTNHTIEPNSGREKEALKELYRITNKFLVLLEPSYELANEDAKKRMNSLGYVTNLYDTAVELGYKILEHRLFDISINSLNPTGLIIIEKESMIKSNNPYCCPLTKKDIKKENNCYYSEESMLAYPIIDDIPCLLSQNAIIATKFYD